jgi:regulator of protease activity HflC (stomatin/prohibitin superfamily)
MKSLKKQTSKFFKKVSKRFSEKKFGTWGVILAVISITVFIVLTEVFVIVEAGHVKVVTEFGRVTERVLDPGLHTKTPFIQSTKTFSTKKVTYETTSAAKQVTSEADYKDYPVDTNTADGQQVDVYYTVRFSVDADKANYVAQNFGSEEALVEKIVKTESRIWVRNIPREYEANDLYTGSVVDVQAAIAEKLRGVFEENGIKLDSVGIREIKFSDEYIRAIEQKQIEAVRIETEKNRAAAAEFEKERTITQAEAEAEKQRLLQQSLTDAVLKNKFYEKWDGKLPTYMGGEGLDFILPQAD